MNDSSAEHILRSHRTIVAAAHRGTVSPDGAVRWAARAAGGEDVGHLAALNGGDPELRAAALNDTGLAGRVMDVLAHGHAQALKDAHTALDRGHPASYPPDEFSRMFPPAAPLGAEDDGDETAPPRPANASAPLSDEELFERLYGYRPEPGYFEGQ